MNDALAKLCSIRHHCFARGVLGRHPSWQGYPQAFRTVNGLYVELRDELKGLRSAGKPPAVRRRSAPR